MWAVLDRYLGRNGYDAQQDKRRVPPGRPDNLNTPLPGDRGAHGGFDSEAKRRSAELWIRLHRGALALAAAALAATIVRTRRG